jgi:hypothetical protein
VMGVFNGGVHFEGATMSLILMRPNERSAGTLLSNQFQITFHKSSVPSQKSYRTAT